MGIIMKKFYTFFAMIFCIFLVGTNILAQTTFFSESIGTVSSTTSIVDHETANGFDEDGATYSGTADIRATTVSTGYTGASGGANVFFTNTIGRYMLIEGINSSAYSNITMSLGHLKSTTAANNELTIEVSSDGNNWSQLTYSRPTGSGTATWLLITPTGTIPSASNLRIRFTQTSATPQFRIDDIKLTGSSSSPTISVNPTTLTGFSYIEGSGPSSEQSFTISGSNLTANISITPPTNYEISTGTGGSFSATNPITLSQSGGSVGSTTIYVRLKAGISTGDYNSEDITASSTGASNKTVTCSGSVIAPLPNAWINELHYDNIDTDADEFIEIVIEDAGSYSLTDFQLYLYNGTDGTSYHNRTLDKFTEGSSYSANGRTFTLYSYLSPLTGIQNGDPDGLALSYQGSLIQFLSYEGTFTAAEGPANGVGSTDIGVAEGSGTPVGASLGLQGTGTQYSNFSWVVFTSNSRGLINANQAVPVELSSFSATVNSNTVNLKWETKTEINNYGFEIERSQKSNIKSETWEKIGFVNGHGNSNSPKQYSFTDKSVTSGKFIYRLKQIDTDGQYEFSKEVEVDLGLPKTFTLGQNYPNPFNPTTKINYTLPVDGNVQLQIFTAGGELVKSLVNERQNAGAYTVEFNAENLASGIYFYKLLANDFIQIRKMLLMK